MPKRLTKEEFVRQLEKEHPNLELLGDYNGNKNYVTVRCKLHNYVYKTKPNWLHRGCDCQKCYDERRGEKRAKDLAKVISDFRKVHGDKYDYSNIIEYKNNHTKLPIYCPKKDKYGNCHGIFYQTALKHISAKEGCPKCAREANALKKSLTTDEFVKKAKEIHGDKYDYSKVKYVNCYSEVDIICPIHGSFQQKPFIHLDGSGCPKCNSSHLEIEVRNFLKRNHIFFIEQKRFEWLGKQSLDFYLPRFKIAIECQGKQHFTSVNHFGGEKAFQKRSMLDKNKYELCKKQNISIIYVISKDCENILKEDSIYNNSNIISESNIELFKKFLN